MEKYLFYAAARRLFAREKSRILEQSDSLSLKLKPLEYLQLLIKAKNCYVKLKKALIKYFYERVNS